MTTSRSNHSCHRSEALRAQEAKLKRVRLSMAVVMCLAAAAEIFVALHIGGRFSSSGHARTTIVETPLWSPGFSVSGRRGNRKRKRMVWKDRLAQIGTESEFRVRYKVSHKTFKEICNKIRPDVRGKFVTTITFQNMKCSIHIMMKGETETETKMQRDRDAD